MPNDKQIKPFYMIMSWSPSRQQLQREFNEVEIRQGRMCVNAQEAERRAQAFSQRLNQERKLGAQDWVARVQLATGLGKYLVKSQPRD